MNILYANWKCFGTEDAIETFQALGHAVSITQISEESHEDIDWSYVEELGKQIKRDKVDLIYSFNFFPSLSEAAFKYGCSYMAFIYDNPSVKAYYPSIINECNYIFTFDSAMYDELRKKGVSTIYYTPLPVNIQRLEKLQTTAKDKQHYSCDIAFVGSLYNESHHLYERLVEKMNNPHLTGFLDGIIEAQLKVYGYNFMSECFSQDMINSMYKAMPYLVPEGLFTNLAYVYSDYFLCRRLAYIERTRIIEMLSMQYKLHLYTKNAETNVGAAINLGPVDYFTDMPKAFRSAKINLNITLRSIKNGIPLRAMDIMGAGGFLLSNYQQDFLLHFEPDKDFVYYSSMEELKDKTAFYLKHDTERTRIARNGRLCIENEHTYIKRFHAMLEVVKGN